MIDPAPQPAPRSTSTGPVYIWVRTTLDWSDEQAFLAQVSANLYPKVELWNALFTLPYHLFRLRVNEIASLNHARVRGAVVAGWDAIPEGALVLPVDDDDWFAPGVAEVVQRETDPAADGCYWASRWVEVPFSVRYRLKLARRRVAPWTAPRFTLGTNNYALVKTAAARPYLRGHVVATRWYDAGGGTLTRIEGHHSIANRTLGSLTSLQYWSPSMSRGALLRKYRRYRALYDGPPPPDLAWSAPHREAMAELMRELELR